jgi:hypothetical protein
MKNNGLVRTGLFRLVPALALFASLALLGACGNAYSPDDDDDWEPGANVRIPLPQAGRAIVDEDVIKILIDYYEVVFTDGTDYYRGVASGSQRYLSVNVPLGTYHVLLLAGNSTYETLLATAFNDDVEIKIGRNEIIMSLDVIALHTDTGSTPPITVTGGTIEKGTLTGKTYIEIGNTDQITFKVDFDSAAFQHLADAKAGASGGGTTFDVEINQLNVREYLTSFEPFIVSGNTTIVLSTEEEYETAVLNTNENSYDSIGRAYLYIEYYAFGVAPGTTPFGQKKWRITNGLAFLEPDVNGALGGAILILYGSSNTAVVTF